jgi:hypothetical protein
MKVVVAARLWFLEDPPMQSPTSSFYQTAAASFEPAIGRKKEEYDLTDAPEKCLTEKKEKSYIQTQCDRMRGAAN